MKSAITKGFAAALVAFACVSTGGAASVSSSTYPCGSGIEPESAAAEILHGGGLNSCGCHFNRKTGECHCHRPKECGCECEPASCKEKDKSGDT